MSRLYLEWKKPEWQEFWIAVLVHQQRSVDRPRERQLCYSRLSLLQVVTVFPPDYTGCSGFPQIIIAAERRVQEYSQGTMFPLCFTMIVRRYIIIIMFDEFFLILIFCFFLGFFCFAAELVIVLFTYFAVLRQFCKHRKPKEVSYTGHLWLSISL